MGSGGRKSSVKSNDGEKSPRKADAGTRLLRKNSQPDSPITIASVDSYRGGGKSVLEQIGQPDHNGWMRKKGERYNTWKLRYFVLKGPHLYYLASSSNTVSSYQLATHTQGSKYKIKETKIKGYINTNGYKVIVDENINPGKYGFRIVHDTEKTHFFSSEEQVVVREWMKALMKATITRDYSSKDSPSRS